MNLFHTAFARILFLTLSLALCSFALSTDKAQAQAPGACIVNFQKITDPSTGNQVLFDYSCSGGVDGDCDGRPTFILNDGGGTGFELFGTEPAMTVVEEPLDGWILDDITCNINQGDPNSLTFDTGSVEDGVIVTCTDPFDLIAGTCVFTNIQACDVTIEKSATTDDGTLFDFTAPGSSDPDFALSDGEDNVVKIPVGGNVDVTELEPEGWRLLDIECSEPEGVEITDIPNGKNFACGPDGGEASCVFVNSPTRNIPTLSEWGLIAMAGLLGIVGFMVLRRKKAAI